MNNKYLNQICFDINVSWRRQCGNIFLKFIFKEKIDAHIKVKQIEYSGERRPQGYLTNEMVQLLFNLRCSSVNEFRDNFHTLHWKTPPCKMLCGEDTDNQRNALSCKIILAEISPNELHQFNRVEYTDLFGSIEENYLITIVYKRIQVWASITLGGLPGLQNSGPDWY